MAIPAVGIDGVRQTVNYNLTPEQTVWNLRSALNVAALNCQDPQHATIIPAYASLLDRNKRKLSTINREVGKQFKDRYGSQGQNAQDDYMTQVYNYFALPPAIDEFCNVATRIAAESLLVEPADLETFAGRGLQSLEAVFEDFYRSYEQYRANVAQWDAQYGTPEVVNPNSYAGPAYYTPADQGFGPEVRGEPEFISEPIVEGPNTPPTALPGDLPAAAASDTAQPLFADPAVSAATVEPATDTPPAGVPSPDPVFVSNPVVSPIPDETD